MFHNFTILYFIYLIINRDISNNLQFNANIKNFGKTINRCNFVNTNIGCYSKNTCSSVEGNINEVTQTSCKIFSENSNFNNNLNGKNNKSIVYILIIGIGLFILFLSIIISLCFILRKNKDEKNNKSFKFLNLKYSSKSSDKFSNELLIKLVNNMEGDLDNSFSKASLKDDNSLLNTNNLISKKDLNNDGLETVVELTPAFNEIVVNESKSSEKKKNDIIIRDPQINLNMPIVSSTINNEFPSAPSTIPSNIEPTAPPLNVENNQNQKITINNDSISSKCFSSKNKGKMKSSSFIIPDGQNQSFSFHNPVMDNSSKKSNPSQSINLSNNNNNCNINNNCNNVVNNNGNNSNNLNNNYNFINGNTNYAGIFLPYSTPTFQTYIERSNTTDQDIYRIDSIRSLESNTDDPGEQNLSVVQLSNPNDQNNDNIISKALTTPTTTNHNSNEKNKSNDNGEIYDKNINDDDNISDDIINDDDNINDNNISNKNINDNNSLNDNSINYNSDDFNDCNIDVDDPNDYSIDVDMGECTILPSFTEIRNYVMKNHSNQDININNIE